MSNYRPLAQTSCRENRLVRAQDALYESGADLFTPSPYPGNVSIFWRRVSV